MILIGNAIDYVPYFIYTFIELGKQGIGQDRGKYELIQVEGIDLEGKVVEIYHNKTQTLTSQYPIIQGGAKNTSQGENHNNKITIAIHTLLRLRFDGHITDKLEFHVFIGNLLRRISSLSYFHCGKKLVA